MTEQRNDSEQAGVWVVGHFDWNWIAEKIYDSEIDALREVNARGYGEVRFIPFGAEISQVALGARA